MDISNDASTSISRIRCKDFQIVKLQEDDKNPLNREVLPQSQWDFEFIWLQEGKAAGLVNGSLHPILPDMMICRMPGQRQPFKPLNGANGYLISFSSTFICDGDTSGEFMNNIGKFNLLARQQNSYITVIREELNAIICILVNEFANEQVFRSELIRYYLRILLCIILRELEKTSSMLLSNSGNWLFTRFLESLETNFKLNKTVAHYASELSISPNYLNQVIKKNTGCCAGKLIRSRILKEAKKNASVLNYSMKETAYSLGFEDVYHFSKFFKNESGVNYSDFRKSYPIHISSLIPTCD